MRNARTNNKIRDHQLQPRVSNICGANFFSKSGYDKHIINHNSGFRYKCKECDKGFLHECYLTHHIKNTHQSKNLNVEAKTARGAMTLRMFMILIITCAPYILHARSIDVISVMRAS